jgi:hypothetical protein
MAVLGAQAALGLLFYLVISLPPERFLTLVTPPFKWYSQEKTDRYIRSAKLREMGLCVDSSWELATVRRGKSL